MNLKFNLTMRYIIIIAILLISNLNTAQCLSGDCINGHGSITFLWGDKYVGGFKDGYFNGFGKLNGKEVTYFNGKLVNN